jgi:hypothetical protein
MEWRSSVSFKKEKMSGQATRRHPDGPAYRCFLSDLTGFTGICRAGPTRTPQEDTLRVVGCQLFAEEPRMNWLNGEWGRYNWS